jgi:hypothetical protein
MLPVSQRTNKSTRCDYYISCSYRCEPYFPHNIRFIASYPPHLNTPLLYSQVQFSSITTRLGIAKETATILDDMRFLIQAVIKQVNREPTDVEKLKLIKTSSWIRDRILQLPEGINDHPLANDFLYKSCRIAALIYCKSIIERIPLYKACLLHDLHHLWGNMWRITLTRWKGIPGIFLFIILSANQAAQNTPYGRFLKNMLKASSSYIALDNWEVVDGSLISFLKLQKWLGDGIVKAEYSSDAKVMEFMHIYRR